MEVAEAIKEVAEAMAGVTGKALGLEGIQTHRTEEAEAFEDSGADVGTW